MLPNLCGECPAIRALSDVADESTSVRNRADTSTRVELQPHESTRRAITHTRMNEKCSVHGAHDL